MVFRVEAAALNFDDIWGMRGKPLAVPGLWGIAFCNDAMAGPRDTLFFAAGPHRWLGSSELDVQGLAAEEAQSASGTWATFGAVLCAGLRCSRSRLRTA